jgi:hypothetical protein
VTVELQDRVSGEARTFYLLNPDGLNVKHSSAESTRGVPSHYATQSADIPWFNDIVEARN